MTDSGSCSLTVIGDGSVGKSSIINAFKTEGFLPVYKQTIGCDFYEKSLPVRGKNISLKVWDIGGQSIHSKNISQYVGTSNELFLVYDVTNMDSFNNLDDWLRIARKYSSSQHIYIVGNKIDLISLRQVNATKHDQFIVENNIQGGLYMSAKSGENVIRAFYQVATEVIGLKLTSYELAFHDKVLGVQIGKDTTNNDGRTSFADDIEAEDRAAEAKKNKGLGCNCTCS
jgi:Ras-related protein Rab-28